jgi:hypothetical protein
VVYGGFTQCQSHIQVEVVALSSYEEKEELFKEQVVVNTM